MFRISKMTDYGTLVLSELGAAAEAPTSAGDIASRIGLGGATVSKLLKRLARAGLVKSQRGSNGGYTLARSAADISAAEIIDAIEGPVAITDCASDQPCDLEAVCGLGNAWQEINRAIRAALEGVSLDDLRTGRGLPRTLTIQPMAIRRGHLPRSVSASN
ncbi:MAG: SUF system Fe-S cluster assembly regulator [Pseudomonadota bacterium]